MLLSCTAVSAFAGVRIISLQVHSNSMERMQRIQRTTESHTLVFMGGYYQMPRYLILDSNE